MKLINGNVLYVYVSPADIGDNIFDHIRESLRYTKKIDIEDERSWFVQLIEAGIRDAITTVQKLASEPNVCGIKIIELDEKDDNPLGDCCGEVAFIDTDHSTYRIVKETKE